MTVPVLDTLHPEWTLERCRELHSDGNWRDFGTHIFCNACLVAIYKSPVGPPQNFDGPVEIVTTKEKDDVL